MPKPFRSTPRMMRRAAEHRRNQTPAEARLWFRVRNHQLQGVGFRRSHAIGRYIVDFCAPRRKLVIELDGYHHLGQSEYDARRTAWLESKGYRVVRFWNHEVLHDLDSVLREIAAALDPPPTRTCGKTGVQKP